MMNKWWCVLTVAGVVVYLCVVVYGERSFFKKARRIHRFVENKYRHDYVMIINLYDRHLYERII